MAIERHWLEKIAESAEARPPYKHTSILYCNYEDFQSLRWTFEERSRLIIPHPVDPDHSINVHGVCIMPAEDIQRGKHRIEMAAERPATISDLAMLVRRLCRHAPDELKSQAEDYLRRKGLQGSPLR